jgi:hypothetical protein
MPTTASRALPDRVNHGRGRLRAGIALAGAVLTLTAIAGCADTQPGDKNPGSGYTDEISALLVKVPALRSDPCRGARASTQFPDCGRFVTEVAGTIAAVRTDLPNQPDATATLQSAVNTYQQLSCDTAGNTPTTQQKEQCPQALTAMGTQLDHLDQLLEQVPTSN